MRGPGIAIGIEIIEGTILMEVNHSSDDERQFTEKVKKPYQKPAFRFEEVFVTSALSCGKITSTQSGCHGLTSAS
jgi:hypothetical protein